MICVRNNSASPQKPLETGSDRGREEEEGRGEERQEINSRKLDDETFGGFLFETMSVRNGQRLERDIEMRSGG